MTASDPKQTFVYGQRGMSLVKFFSLIFLLVLGMTPNASEACDIEGLKNRFAGGEIRLSKPMKIKEIEQKEMRVAMFDGKRRKVPFGRINALWEKLKSKYVVGDCIVYFDTTTDAPLSGGRTGYMLVRGDEMVDSIVISIQ